jgi:hypothetical protein
MLSDRLKKRLVKDRPLTSITIRIPVDVVESMKEIAPRKGFSGYQTLLKSYVSEGLRRDEAMLSSSKEARLIEALKKRGVPESLIKEAEKDAA